MRIAFDPMVAACSAALILHVRTWTAARKPLKPQAVIGWPERRPPLTRLKLYRPRLSSVCAPARL
jgi:hypothetical protein